MITIIIIEDWDLFCKLFLRSEGYCCESIDILCLVQFVCCICVCKCFMYNILLYCVNINYYSTPIKCNRAPVNEALSLRRVDISSSCSLFQYIDTNNFLGSTLFFAKNDNLFCVRTFVQVSRIVFFSSNLHSLN